MLTEIGFKVTRISANVMRHHNGETSAASHLCLLVKLPGGRKKYLVAQQRSLNQHRTLRGRVFSVLEQGVNESKTIDSPEALVAILAKEFRLNIQGIPSLWPGIVARHEKLFGQD